MGIKKPAKFLQYLVKPLYIMGGGTKVRQASNVLLREIPKD